MKTIQLTVLLLLCPLFFFAQTLTGLWIGSVRNDSTTIRKDQSFEIVLTQYKDKVYGFSRATFIVNDSLFYIVKRVKGTIEGDVCAVKDDEVVSYNFHGRLDKGIKMVSTFHFDHQDSVWRMDGDWKTNKTKKYYAVSGKIALAQEKDLEKSKIFPHLEELKLADDVAFYKESKKVSEEIASVKQPAGVNSPEKIDKDNNANRKAPDNSKAVAVAQVKQPELKDKPVITEKKEAGKDNVITIPAKPAGQNEAIAKEEKPAIVTENKPNTVAKSSLPVNNPVKEQTVTENKTASVPINNRKDSVLIAKSKTTQTNQPVNDIKKPLLVKEEKQDSQKSESVDITKPAEQKKETSITQSKPEIQKPVSIFTEAKPANVPAAAEFVAQRKVVAPQVVEYKSDSLELALYDNGEVDGDTVSILLNGEIIMAKQGLKASAIKKTIYFPAGKDEPMTLVLYAENLGKYPPNTGLLIVHDGDDSYQIRFSADFQQNAAVIFRRKKN